MKMNRLHCGIENDKTWIAKETERDKSEVEMVTKKSFIERFSSVYFLLITIEVY